MLFDGRRPSSFLPSLSLSPFLVGPFKNSGDVQMLQTDSSSDRRHFDTKYYRPPEPNTQLCFRFRHCVGKIFNRYDVAAALCMSIGLIFFTLADSKVQPNFNLYGNTNASRKKALSMSSNETCSGVLIICSALVADAAIGNYQEKIMKAHQVSNVEIVFYSFMFGFILVLVGLLLTNNFFASLYFWNQVQSSFHCLTGWSRLFFSFPFLPMVMVCSFLFLAIWVSILFSHWSRSTVHWSV